MLCVVIKGPTFPEVESQIAQASIYADLLELRLDLISWDISSLARLRSQCNLPLIFTLRSQKQGGNDARREESRCADIRCLIALKPQYFDLEHDISPSFINEIISQHPDVKIIISYHHFTETPSDLELIYREMYKIPAHYYKMAVMAKNSLDALRLLCFAKQKHQLIAISMGLQGQISRIIGPLIGSPITYASLEEDQGSAPGQLPARILVEQYHYRSLSLKSRLYGLIGNPIDRSISDKTHNAFMRVLNIDAVYVKLEVHPSELAEFVPLARQLFQGLSVTMPLKEEIMRFLDHIDSEAIRIGSSNTLVFENEKISGYNTDGKGALDAIEKESSVKGQHIVIIGAGGAARAIVYEALQRGARVTVINRDKERAKQMAHHFSCTGRALEDMALCAQEGYNILINCTPSALPIDPEHILPEAIVMDIMTKPRETLFLQEAEKRGCRIIYGYHMFMEQALGQFNLWLEQSPHIQKHRTIFERNIFNCLI